MPQKYTVESNFHNARLDRWFKSNVISLPQSLLEKIIRKNKIKINKKKAKTSYRVQHGDLIEVYDISKFKWKVRQIVEDCSVTDGEILC